jgi:hypothetical protein
VKESDRKYAASEAENNPKESEDRPLQETDYQLSEQGLICRLSDGSRGRRFVAGRNVYKRVHSFLFLLGFCFGTGTEWFNLDGNSPPAILARTSLAEELFRDLKRAPTMFAPHIEHGASPYGRSNTCSTRLRNEEQRTQW